MQTLNKIETEEVIVAEVETVTQASVEQLPISIIREKLDAKGIVHKSTDKKPALIKALFSGKATTKEVVKKAAPRLEDKQTAQVLPIISKTLKAELDKMAAQGLRYEIDEEFSCINFYGVIPTCANIDQSINNILGAAREAIRRPAYGAETSSTKDLW